MEKDDRAQERKIKRESGGQSHMISDQVIEGNERWTKRENLNGRAQAGEIKSRDRARDRDRERDRERQRETERNHRKNGSPCIRATTTAVAFHHQSEPFRGAQLDWQTWGHGSSLETNAFTVVFISITL